LVCWSVWWCVGLCVGQSVGWSVMVGRILGSGYVPPQFSLILYTDCTPSMDRAALGYELTTSKPGSSMGLILIITLSCACLLHKVMLRGVTLGILWGTIKSTFYQRSSPNHSYSKNEVYPRIKHDAESLK
jgi:hypothetical protein